MDQPAPPKASPHVARRRGRRRFWLAVGVLLALVILFEVGIRQAPPDGMIVTYDDSMSVYVDRGTQVYTTPRDQQTISDYYAAFNRAPVRPAWILHGCAMDLDPTSVVFTWRGIPVESWTMQGCDYIENAGGASDAIAVQHLLPEISMPPPAPISG